MKRPAPWQARRIATAKALRELPKCDYAECERRGMGHVTVTVQSGNEVKLAHLWVCPTHAQRLQKQRAAAPRET